MVDNTVVKPRSSASWLRLQLALAVAVFAVTALAPVRGGAALLLPLAKPGDGAVLRWAMARGALPIGPGPGGGIMLARTDPALGWRALAGGMIALRIPESLCSNAGRRNGRPD